MGRRKLRNVFFVKILLGIFVAVFLGGFGWLTFIQVAKAVETTHKEECRKWQRQAKEFMPGLFYITQEEKDQCDYWNIKVNAPVRG